MKTENLKVQMDCGSDHYLLVRKVISIYQSRLEEHFNIDGILTELYEYMIKCILIKERYTRMYTRQMKKL